MCRLEEETLPPPPQQQQQKLGRSFSLDHAFFSLFSRSSHARSYSLDHAAKRDSGRHRHRQRRMFGSCGCARFLDASFSTDVPSRSATQTIAWRQRLSVSSSTVQDGDEPEESMLKCELHGLETCNCRKARRGLLKKKLNSDVVGYGSLYSLPADLNRLRSHAAEGEPVAAVATSQMDSKKRGTLRGPVAKRTPEASVTIRGWLDKQGSEGLRLWKTRWFVLSEYCLYYYKDCKEDKLLGSITLPSYRVCPVTQDDRVHRKYAFRIQHSNMRTYFFACDSKQKMTDWMNAISLASIMQRQEESGSPSERLQHRLDRPSVSSLGSSRDGSPWNGLNSSQQDGSISNNTSFNTSSGRDPRQPLYANAPPKPRRLNSSHEQSSSPEPEEEPPPPESAPAGQTPLAGQQTLRWTAGGARRIAERRTPDVYSPPVSQRPLAAGGASDYSDLYNDDSVTGGGSPSRVGRPQIRDSYASSGGCEYPRIPEHPDSAHAPVVACQNGVVRPQSADFLQQQDRSGRRSAKFFSSPQHVATVAANGSAPRPKSSMAQCVPQGGSADYWSEQEYANKMRQASYSAAVVVCDPAGSAGSASGSSQTAPARPSPLVGPSTASPSPASYPHQPSTSSTLPLDREAAGNTSGGPRAARTGGRSGSFCRSASARYSRQRALRDQQLQPSDVMNTSMQDHTDSAADGGGDSRRTVQQREESMKRLLEWKQRMLLSPLTRKSPKVTPTGKFPPDQYRRRVREEQERTEIVRQPRPQTVHGLPQPPSAADGGDQQQDYVNLLYMQADGDPWRASTKGSPAQASTSRHRQPSQKLREIWRDPPAVANKQDNRRRSSAVEPPPPLIRSKTEADFRNHTKIGGAKHAGDSYQQAGSRFQSQKGKYDDELHNYNRFYPPKEKLTVQRCELEPTRTPSITRIDPPSLTGAEDASLGKHSDSGYDTLRAEAEAVEERRRCDADEAGRAWTGTRRRQSAAERREKSGAAAASEARRKTGAGGDVWRRDGDKLDEAHVVKEYSYEYVKPETEVSAPRVSKKIPPPVPIKKHSGVARENVSKRSLVQDRIQSLKSRLGDAVAGEELLEGPLMPTKMPAEVSEAQVAQLKSSVDFRATEATRPTASEAHVAQIKSLTSKATSVTDGRTSDVPFSDSSPMNSLEFRGIRSTRDIIESRNSRSKLREFALDGEQPSIDLNENRSDSLEDILTKFDNSSLARRRSQSRKENVKFYNNGDFNDNVGFCYVQEDVDNDPSLYGCHNGNVVDNAEVNGVNLDTVEQRRSSEKVIDGATTVSTRFGSHVEDQVFLGDYGPTRDVAREILPNGAPSRPPSVPPKQRNRNSVSSEPVYINHPAQLDLNASQEDQYIQMSCQRRPVDRSGGDAPCLSRQSSTLPPAPSAPLPPLPLPVRKPAASQSSGADDGTYMEMNPNMLNLSFEASHGMFNKLSSHGTDPSLHDYSVIPESLNQYEPMSSTSKPHEHVYMEVPNEGGRDSGCPPADQLDTRSSKQRKEDGGKKPKADRKKTDTKTNSVNGSASDADDEGSKEPEGPPRTRRFSLSDTFRPASYYLQMHEQREGQDSSDSDLVSPPSIPTSPPPMHELESSGRLPGDQQSYMINMLLSSQGQDVTSLACTETLRRGSITSKRSSHDGFPRYGTDNGQDCSSLLSRRNDRNSTTGFCNGKSESYNGRLEGDEMTVLPSLENGGLVLGSEDRYPDSESTPAQCKSLLSEEKYPSPESGGYMAMTSPLSRPKPPAPTPKDVTDLSQTYENLPPPRSRKSSEVSIYTLMSMNSTDSPNPTKRTSCSSLASIELTPVKSPEFLSEFARAVQETVSPEICEIKPNHVRREILPETSSAMVETPSADSANTTANATKETGTRPRMPRTQLSAHEMSPSIAEPPPSSDGSNPAPSSALPLTIHHRRGSSNISVASVNSTGSDGRAPYYYSDLSAAVAVQERPSRSRPQLNNQRELEISKRQDVGRKVNQICSPEDKVAQAGRIAAQLRSSVEYLSSQKRSDVDSRNVYVSDTLRRSRALGAATPDLSAGQVPRNRYPSGLLMKNGDEAQMQPHHRRGRSLDGMLDESVCPPMDQQLGVQAAAAQLRRHGHRSLDPVAVRRCQTPDFLSSGSGHEFQLGVRRRSHTPDVLMSSEADPAPYRPEDRPPMPLPREILRSSADVPRAPPYRPPPPPAPSVHQMAPQAPDAWLDAATALSSAPRPPDIPRSPSVTNPQHPGQEYHMARSSRGSSMSASRSMDSLGCPDMEALEAPPVGRASVYVNEPLRQLHHQQQQQLRGGVSSCQSTGDIRRSVQHQRRQRPPPPTLDQYQWDEQQERFRASESLEGLNSSQQQSTFLADGLPPPFELDREQLRRWDSMSSAPLQESRRRGRPQSAPDFSRYDETLLQDPDDPAADVEALQFPPLQESCDPLRPPESSSRKVVRFRPASVPVTDSSPPVRIELVPPETQHQQLHQTVANGHVQFPNGVPAYPVPPNVRGSIPNGVQNGFPPHFPNGTPLNGHAVRPSQGNPYGFSHQQPQQTNYAQSNGLGPRHPVPANVQYNHQQQQQRAQLFHNPNQHPPPPQPWAGPPRGSQPGGFRPPVQVSSTSTLPRQPTSPTTAAAPPRLSTAATLPPEYRSRGGRPPGSPPGGQQQHARSPQHQQTGQQIQPQVHSQQNTVSPSRQPQTGPGHSYQNYMQHPARSQQQGPIYAQHHPAVYGQHPPRQPHPASYPSQNPPGNSSMSNGIRGQAPHYASGLVQLDPRVKPDPRAASTIYAAGSRVYDQLPAAHKSGGHQEQPGREEERRAEEMDARQRNTTYQDPRSCLQQRGNSRSVVGDSGFISDLKAGDLLGKSNEELTLLLIQLRRQSSSIVAAHDKIRHQLNNSTRDPGAGESQQQRESRRQLTERCQFQLAEFDKQLEMTRPLISLVDNMLKLSSLYDSRDVRGAAAPSQEHGRYMSQQQAAAERRPVGSREEQQRHWQRIAAQETSSGEDRLEKPSQSAGAVGRPMAESGGAARAPSLRPMAESGGAARAPSLRPMAESGSAGRVPSGRQDSQRFITQQRALQDELHRVRSALSSSSKSLDETTAENNRLEREMHMLRQRLHVAIRETNGDANTTAGGGARSPEVRCLESELQRLQGMIDELSAKRSRLSQQVLSLTHPDDAAALQHQLQQRQHWLETDVDSLVPLQGEHNLPPPPPAPTAMPLYVDTYQDRSMGDDMRCDTPPPPPAPGGGGGRGQAESPPARVEDTSCEEKASLDSGLNSASPTESSHPSSSSQQRGGGLGGDGDCWSQESPPGGEGAGVWSQHPEEGEEAADGMVVVTRQPYIGQLAGCWTHAAPAPPVEFQYPPPPPPQEDVWSQESRLRRHSAAPLPSSVPYSQPPSAVAHGSGTLTRRPTDTRSSWYGGEMAPLAQTARPLTAYSAHQARRAASCVDLPAVHQAGATAAANGVRQQEGLTNGEKNTTPSPPTSNGDHQQLAEADEKLQRFYGILPKEKPLEIKTVRIVKRESQLRQKDRTRRPADDANGLTSVGEDGNYESSDSVIERDAVLSQFRRSMSLPRGYERKQDKPQVSAVSRIPNFRHHMLKKLVDRNPGSRPSAHELLFGSTPSLVPSSAAIADSLTALPPPPPLPAPPVQFKSDAARQIVEELRTPPSTVVGAGHRRTGRATAAGRNKRRHYTISGSRPAAQQAALTAAHFRRHKYVRSADDMDIDRAGSSGVGSDVDTPDVVKSSLTRIDTRYDESTIDSLLGTPQKIHIPERYVPELEVEQISAAERIQRSKKAASIRKMLTQSTGFLETIGKTDFCAPVSCQPSTVGMADKLQRAHILQLNEIIAKQVTEKSKRVAVEA